ncbi:MAG: hypothetical protein ACLUBL_08415 [Fusobacterium sp.]|uniref:hypothetical protein n=1 Tax=Fusobacterium sp. TaxID=68766 RepID=UPI003996A6BB
MKKLLIKLFICIITIFSFTGCYTLSKTYYYETRPNEYVYIYATVLDSEKSDSPISMIEISPVDFANLKKSKKVEILSDKIIAEYNGKKYVLKVVNKTAVLPYREGIILKEGTVVYFGKVKVDGKMIIDMPPVKLKQYLKVVKFNPVAGGLNIDTKKEIYYGPAEGYKGR